MNFKLELLKSFTLPDFPSGSSVNFHDKKLFLIGDDASHILILDDNYQKIEAIQLFDSPVKRIPKKEKADFETSTLLRLDRVDYLLVLGSGSRKNRTTIILIDLVERSFESYNYRTFIKSIKNAGIEEVNIECSSLIQNRFILGNRGNTLYSKNHIILTDKDFWRRQHEVDISIFQLELPIQGETFIGISELSYVESLDLLLVTLSSELTSNSFDDGTIGDSYLGWIRSISQKINQPLNALHLEGIINLTEVAQEFKSEKIEGLCVEPAGDKEFVLHLISDNDQGQSKLFKVKMSWMQTQILK